MLDLADYENLGVKVGEMGKFFSNYLFFAQDSESEVKKSTTGIFDPENRLFHIKFLSPPVRYFFGGYPKKIPSLCARVDSFL